MNSESRKRIKLLTLPMYIFRESGDYWLTFVAVLLTIGTPAPAVTAPYPHSSLIEGITWHADTHRTDAGGSDLWPTTWAEDGYIYTSWGDGAGFGSDFPEESSRYRVSLGFARIEGFPPDNWLGININGGKQAKNPASFPKKGKCGGLLSVNCTLYAWLNLQDDTWPGVNQALAWSTDKAATWMQAPWVWRRGRGNFKAQTFLQSGCGYKGPRDDYIYIYGRNEKDWGQGKHGYLARVPRSQIQDRNAYTFFTGTDAAGQARWDADIDRRQPHFTDPAGVESINVVYNKALNRYILTCHRGGQGTLGIFDGPEPWGPWTTVAYYDNWLRLKGTGKGRDMLYVSIPAKWISPDGLTMWFIYTGGLDSFNMVKGTLKLKEKAHEIGVPMGDETQSTTKAWYSEGEDQPKPAVLSRAYTSKARLVPVGLTFDSRVYRTPDARRCGDNFCNTWACENKIYFTIDDGNGWPDVSSVNTELNHRIWRFKGGPGSYSPEYLNNYPDYEWGKNWYAFGIIAVDGYIYYTISRPYKVDKRGIKLLYSPDYGNAWFRHDGVSAEQDKYTEDSNSMFFWNEYIHLFSYCDFVQCGKDYQDAKDNYVYLYCKITEPEPSIYVARVPRGHENIVNKSKYEYFRGYDSNASPVWTPDITQIGKIMSFPKGYYHSAFLPSVVYNKGLDLFLMVVGARPRDRFSGKPPILRMYWSDSPAGPWIEFYRDDNWRADSPENIPYQPKFISKFTSADGRTMYMNYSDCSNRWKRHYVWNQQRFALKLKPAHDRKDE